MAEEQEANDGGEAKAEKPKKPLPLLMIGLGLQSVVMLAAVGLVVKGIYFTKGPDLSVGHMRERAIASIKDDRNNIQNFDLKDFTVNLPASRMIKANIQLEVSDPDTLAVIERRLPAIKYKIINLIASTSVSKTDTFQGKLQLKDSLREAINDEILSNGHSKGIVREVFFSDFYLK